VKRLAAAAGLLRVADPLLAARYRAGLAAFGIAEDGPVEFHLDAVGYSPEWAEALADPFYLGGGALEARGVVVEPGQLAAPVVHPGFGFAATSWQHAARLAGRGVAELTLREPLLVEARAEGAPFATLRELADPERLELRLRTPGGLIEAQRLLAERQREFLASDRLWLDDDFLAQLARLAERVRGLPELPEGFEAARVRLAPLCFTPAFGGAYRIEEPGAPASSATTTLLAGAADGEPVAGARSLRGRRLEIRPLGAADALEVLERHRIARVDLGAWSEQPGELLRLRRGLAVAAWLAGDPAQAPDEAGERQVDEALRDAAAPLSDAQRELEALTRRLASRAGRTDPESLAPETRLQLAVPTSTRAEVRRFVRHVQAFFAPADLEAAFAHAPDLFFARVGGLPQPIRARLAGWLQGEGCMAAAAARA
jgi:hypothetical protein